MQQTRDKTTRFPVRDVLLRTTLMLFLWWVLSEGDLAGLAFGILMVVLVTTVSLWLFPPTGWYLRWWRLPGFLCWFVGRSLLAGLDVAGRLLQPRLRLHPGVVTLPLMLSAGPPCWWLANSLSLLPGTLSVELREQSIEVHSLDTRLDVPRAVADAQRRVADLYGAFPGEAA